MRAVAHTQPRDTSADTTPPVPDALLIRHSLREPARFTEVFDRHYAEIHGYVTRRLGPSLAEDVASETFLIAFDRRRRYDVLAGLHRRLAARGAAHRSADLRLPGRAVDGRQDDEDRSAEGGQLDRRGQEGQHSDRGAPRDGDRRQARPDALTELKAVWLARPRVPSSGAWSSQLRPATRRATPGTRPSAASRRFRCRRRRSAPADGARRARRLTRPIACRA
jgi:hypothetical protein